jgi:hypothetical protein
MRWPWSSRKDLEQAKKQKEEAEQRVENTRPLAEKLAKHDRTNQFAARFRAALGGDR